MNPNSGEGQPQSEAPRAPERHEPANERAIETRPASAESTAGKNQAPPSTTPALTMPPIAIMPNAPAIPAPAASQTDITDENLSDDSDLIEKQWVERAKAIVAQTQDDPYRQKKEMGKTGAQYIKKRFNKTIPTDDTVIA